jgi:hypothetical protein
MARRVKHAAVIALLFACALAAQPQLPPAPASGNQWTLAMIPDPQGYNQSYDIWPGEKWKGKGYQYKERFVQQIKWIVENRKRYHIRFAAEMGDNVQHNGYDPVKAADPASDDARIRGEWLNAVRALNEFHEGADPTRPVYMPYAVAIGNHDYHSGNRADLTSTEYEQFLGPGRWRDAGGKIRRAFAGWYKGDDMGWRYTVNGMPAGTGSGRNSYQIFPAGGRMFLHLTLECAATDQGLAWAKEVLARYPGTPAIVTIHGFLRGGQFADADRMGRKVVDGPNPTNDARQIWEKLIFPNDQIFMLLCGHIYMQERVVMKNGRGNDVHMLEACYHLNYGGGRIKISEKPPGGWAYTGTTDDLDRNGSGWMRLLMFDPDANKIRVYTYSPVLGLWAGNRKPGNTSGPDGQDGVWWNRTFPIGDNVVEEFSFDFAGRFGKSK